MNKTQAFTARVSSWQARGETFFGAIISMGTKVVHRIEDRATQQQAVADATDWAVEMGKHLQWEDAPVARASYDFSASGGDPTGEAVASPAAEPRVEAVPGANSNFGLEPMDPRGPRAGSPAPNLQADLQPLTAMERVRLRALEQAVQNGLDAAKEARDALAEISAQKLYKEKYGSFEEYCEERWGFSARRGWQFVAWSAVEKDLVAGPGPAPEVLPQSESQARPLAKLEPEARREVWDAAVKKAPAPSQVTAKHVEEAVREHEGKPLEYEVPWAMADRGGKIEKAHLWRLFPKGSNFASAESWMLWDEKDKRDKKDQSGPVVKLKAVFEWEECLYAAAEASMQTHKIVWSCYELQPEAFYEGPKEPRGVQLHGRRVEWKGAIYRLGPASIFRAIKPQEDLKLESEPEPDVASQGESESADFSDLRTRNLLGACTRAIIELRGVQDFFQKSESEYNQLEWAVNAVLRVEEAAKAKKRDASDGFVLCRMASRFHHNQKPRFCGKRGGAWASNLDKVKAFADRNAAAAAAHSYDEVISLEEARERLEAAKRKAAKAKLKAQAAKIRERWKKARAKR
ncbi:MAG: hypothetical protein KGL39_27870 [Patescibacteria group bacterium]|nr:hypothetical protein [Patescibacteria group bacterium]